MATMTRGHKKQNAAAGNTPGTPAADSSFSLQEVLMEIRNDLGGLKTAVDDMTQQLKENKNQLKTIGDQMGSAMESIARMDKRVHKLETQEKRFELEMLKQEMETASHILRIQNVMQSPDEKLQDIAVNILNSILKIPEQEIAKELDYVFRVHNLFTKRANQPPELVIKLYRRLFRDSVLSAPGISEASYNGNKLTILREVPWKIRQNRKQYKTFTRILREKGVVFRWLVPEGLQVLWEGKWAKIESLTKLQKFVKINAEKLGLAEKLGKIEEEIQKMMDEAGAR